MGKLSSTFNRIKDTAIGIYGRYLVTIITGYVVAILMIINEADNDVFSHDSFSKCMMFLSVFMAGAFFIETVFQKKKQDFNTNKVFIIILYVSSLVVSFVSTEIVYESDENSYPAYNFSKVIVVYLVFLVGFSLVHIIRNKNISFQTYVARALFGLLKVWMLFIALFLATLLLLWLFDELIIDFDYWDFLMYTEYFLAAAVYLPFSLVALIDTDQDNSRFTKGVVLYVFTPCLLIAFLIIYLYIIKIFVTNEIPSNTIFDICAYLFAVGVPIWTIAYSFTAFDRNNTDKNPNLYHRIIKIMKYIYAPFIILEIYAIGVRIGEYGITANRYAAIMFIIFQIIYEAWELMILLVRKKKGSMDSNVYGKHYEGLILVAMSLVLIGFVCPFLNFDYVSLASQSKILKKNFDSNVEKAYGAYSYLQYDIQGKKYIDRNYTDTQIEQFVQRYYEFDKYTDMVNDAKREMWSYYSERTGSISTKGMDVSGYSKIYPADAYFYSDNDEEIDINNLSFSDCGMEFKGIDFTACVEYYLDQYNNNVSRNEIKPYIVAIDINHDFYIEYITFSYIKELKKYKNLRIEGYILEK